MTAAGPGRLGRGSKASGNSEAVAVTSVAKGRTESVLDALVSGAIGERRGMEWRRGTGVSIAVQRGAYTRKGCARTYGRVNALMRGDEGGANRRRRTWEKSTTRRGKLEDLGDREETGSTQTLASTRVASCAKPCPPPPSGCLRERHLKIQEKAGPERTRHVPASVHPSKIPNAAWNTTPPALLTNRPLAVRASVHPYCIVYTLVRYREQARTSPDSPIPRNTRAIETQKPGGAAHQRRECPYAPHPDDLTLALTRDDTGNASSGTQCSPATEF
ncbi:hypothetical protein FB451DRAFT_1180740 [Mycena latifolia]|nr:hypothetical protein FB451DRAFT_1180740 [Mycena latifolia]